MREAVAVGVGGSAEISATLPIAVRAETVTVTADAPSVLATTSTGRNVAKGTADVLPVGRRPVDVAELAPV